MQTPQPVTVAQPKWVRVLATSVLLFGIALVFATGVGSYFGEELGVMLACATAAPLGFGVVATLVARKNREGPTMGSVVGKPIGCGCASGLLLFLFTAIFFLSIFPKL